MKGIIMKISQLGVLAPIFSRFMTRSTEMQLMSYDYYVSTPDHFNDHPECAVRVRAEGFTLVNGEMGECSIHDEEQPGYNYSEPAPCVSIAAPEGSHFECPCGEYTTRILFNNSTLHDLVAYVADEEND